MKKFLYSLLFWGALAHAQLVMPIMGPAAVPVAGGGTCGHTNIELGNSGSFYGANFAIALAACTPTQNETVTDIQVYINSCGGCGATWNAAIYDSDGGSGAAGSMLCQAVPLTSETAAAWNPIVPVTCPTLSSGHTYWLVFNTGSGSVNAAMQNSSGNQWYKAQTCCTFLNFSSPDNFTGTGSIYVDVTP